MISHTTRLPTFVIVVALLFARVACVKAEDGLPSQPVDLFNESTPEMGEPSLYSAEVVSFDIFAIRAHHSLDDSSHVAQEIPSALASFSASLAAVPYQNFDLTERRSLTTPLRKKHTLVMADGQVLQIRPLYIKDDRLCLWVKWTDGAGMEVLDSRMHVDMGQGMLAGIEGDSDSGLILAVRVRNR